MKQHITPKELNELSDRGKEKLREWYEPYITSFVPGNPYYPCYRLTGHEYDNNGYCKVCFNPSPEKKNKSKGNLPLLSIGQMIEFLDEQGGFLLNITRQVSSKNEKLKKPRWGVFNLFTNDKYFKLELVNALWQAVKKVLEN